MSAAYLRGEATPLPSVHIRYWCQGKQRFESAVLAVAVAGRSRRGYRRHYWCRNCGGFHIGSALAERPTGSPAMGLIR